MGKPVYIYIWCQIISALGCAECDWRCSVPLLGVLRWVGWVGWVAELKNWLYLGTVSGWGTHLNHPIYNHPIYGMESQKKQLEIRNRSSLQMNEQRHPVFDVPSSGCNCWVCQESTRTWLEHCCCKSPTMPSAPTSYILFTLTQVLAAIFRQHGLAGEKTLPSQIFNFPT